MMPLTMALVVDENDADNAASATFRPCGAVSAAVWSLRERDQSMMQNPEPPAPPLLEFPPACQSPRCMISRPATLLDVDLQCPISLSIIREGDALTQLPCRHVLLEHATRQLLVSSRPCCPICFSHV